MNDETLANEVVLGDRYIIRQLIGRGGMGHVYLAADCRLDRQVAVKEMLEQNMSQSELLSAAAQFNHEARLLAALSHPNLPVVSDFFEFNSRFYLVMEYLQGATLDRVLCDAKGQVEIGRVLNWGVQLADTLAYLHSQEPPIIFRDLKPANIFLLEQGEIKLIDFGIARRFMDGTTHDTMQFGSPGYAPPEQYGKTQTDPRSDIYALGATLHQLLTGRDPATAPFRFPNARSINPLISPEVERMLENCLQLEPDKRTCTALEVKEILQAASKLFINDEHQVSPTPDLPVNERENRPNRTVISARLQHAESRRRTHKALSLSIICALAIIGVGYLIQRLTVRPSVGIHNDQRAVTPVPPPRITTTTPEVDNGSSTHTTNLLISSNITGVPVVLDDKPLGATPVEVKELSPGNHSIHLAPDPSGGYAHAVREIQISSEDTRLELHTQLAALSPCPNGFLPGVEVKNINEQTGNIHPPIGTRVTHPGVMLTMDFRIYNAVGKNCQICLFIYGQDQVTPLRPRIPTPEYQNTDGQLCISKNVQADSAVMDFPVFTLFIPENAIPLPYNQTFYRAVIFIDGKVLWQSSARPLPAPSERINLGSSQ